MRFRRITFSLLSPLLGVHVGVNPVSGQRFVHIAPLPFVGLDFHLQPYLDEVQKVDVDAFWRALVEGDGQLSDEELVKRAVQAANHG